MRALAHNKTTIVRAVGEEVNETLETTESRPVRILVLVGPGLIGGEICAVGEAVVDSVERDDEVFISINFLEGVDNARLAADGPYEVLVTGAVGEKHALFIDQGKVLGVDRRWVITVVTKTAGMVLVIGWLCRHARVALNGRSETKQGSNLIHLS